MAHPEALTDTPGTARTWSTSSPKPHHPKGLTLSHVIQSRAGISIAKTVKALRPLRSATITINGATQTFPPAIPDHERKILTDLGFKPGY